MLLFATMASLQLQAKKHPFVMEGKKWVYAKNDGTKKITYVIHGDTVINGEAFMKFFRSENNGNSIYFGAVQEIDKMVFIVYADEVQKGLVYDFREKPDSPVTLASGLTLNVSFECKQEFDSELYNRIRYSHPPFPNGEAFIEYMSAIDGFGGMEMDLFCRDITDINYTLMECYENGEYLFNAFDTYTWTVYNWMPYACSLVKEGKRWEYVCGDVNPVFRYVYTLQGDTTICGKAYKKMYRSKDKGEPEYVSAMREEDGKVYKVFKGSEEHLLFDFNAKVGDVVFSDESNGIGLYLTVKDIDHVLVGDREQRRFILTQTETSNNGAEKLEYPDDVVWVEGIGSVGLFDSPESVFATGSGGWLLGCYEDDRMVFSSEDFYPGQEISYKALTIDDAQNIFGWGPCLLTLAGSRVEACEDDCLVVADINSGNKVRLFDMGCTFASGTGLGGSIAGLLGEWNDMMTLFPTRNTDVSTILSDADGIHDVVNGEDIHGESLYDLQGRSVGNGISHLKKGIYIIEGRKAVVR